ncbi:retinoid-inducible serine carboxypeptidase-like [Sitophilus oryzae]|uniref:Retinoid-inducible serine carboxypeptidase n=1 Tax=Sitophilus oryzae TaxID=7048 RepID=A0A6J2Y5C3_SITOR|nr:retinoid-inducible serine carboxypeptidase-like [Sitophilus oryzae]
MVLKYCVFLFLCIVLAKGKAGFGQGRQNWGFVPINEKSHMFWWLYYTSSTGEYIQKPLVIWLQGGPGGSSTGIGNFLEIGPLNVDLEEREADWTKHVNVLFVDNPVGTGFSYVSDSDIDYFAKNNSVIAQDFLIFLKRFFHENPEFQYTPTYIFGQSYGGKMATDIGLLLYQESKLGNILCNLKGIALGGPWISPIDSISYWHSYLYNLGFIDYEGSEQLKNMTDFIRGVLSTGDYTKATLYNRVVQYTVNLLTTVDFHNIMTKQVKQSSVLLNSSWLPIPIDIESVGDSMPDDFFQNFDNIKKYKGIKSSKPENLYRLMNGPVRDALNITTEHRWGDQRRLVHSALYLDNMKPVTDVVERLLNETDLEISVCNGQLDLIVNTPGTLKWVNSLKWNNKNQWTLADRTPIILENVYEGYQKRYGKLNFYWVHRAGHMVPTGNPQTMLYILKQIIGIDD